MAEDDPTAPGAIPRSEPVPLATETVSQDEVGTKIGDIAEGFVNAVLTEDPVDEAFDAAAAPGELLEAPKRAASRRRSGKSVEASPLLAMPKVTDPEGIALFVHGGDVTSHIPARRGDPAYLRIVPFARDLERRSRGRFGGAVLRLSMRGWNDPDLPAIEDTMWALRVLRERYPDTPIALVGHSMGGRVVLHLGDEADVDALVGLAPWAADEYHADDFVRTPLLIVHGRRDTVTDPDASEDLVQRVRAAGGDATFVPMKGWHAMLWQANDWHKTCSTFLIAKLGRAGASR